VAARPRASCSTPSLTWPRRVNQLTDPSRARSRTVPIHASLCYRLPLLIDACLIGPTAHTTKHETKQVIDNHCLCLDQAWQYHLVKGDSPDFDTWRARVFGAGVCWAFEPVAVDVEAFDDAWVTAVTAGRVGTLEDFSDGLSAGKGKPFRGKTPSDRLPGGG
jgi:hypothetical protein